MSKAFLVTPGVVIRRDINHRWPKHDIASDGWIADGNHKPPSDHIPDAAGAVRATDHDIDGIHVPTVIAAMVTNGATSYVIHNRRIMDRVDGFRPRHYTGTNPHTGHIHRSTLHTSAADRNDRPYLLIQRGPRWSTLAKGATGTFVAELQGYLNAWGASLVVDSVFGPKTLAAVKSWQSHRGLRVDGIVGPTTRRSLLAGPDRYQ